MTRWIACAALAGTLLLAGLASACGPVRSQSKHCAAAPTQIKENERQATRLRAYKVSCRRARRVAGRYARANDVPRGWACQQPSGGGHGSSLYRCIKHNTPAEISFELVAIAPPA